RAGERPPPGDREVRQDQEQGDPDVRSVLGDVSREGRGDVTGCPVPKEGQVRGDHEVHEVGGAEDRTERLHRHRAPDQVRDEGLARTAATPYPTPTTPAVALRVRRRPPPAPLAPPRPPA